MFSTKSNILIKTDTRTHHIPLYRVLLHNDDINDMLFVMKVLQEIFKFDEQDATKIMLEAHETGVALCKVEPRERAELHQGQLQSFSLTATIEPEE